MLKLYDQKTEYRVNPIGLDVPQPAFSWKLKSDKKAYVRIPAASPYLKVKPVSSISLR